jgi:hypothetical protein
MNKQQILAAIIETTHRNNGTPPGKQKFLSETGIKESDWSGKYWTKWSDAIVEAGFSPNQMQSSYEDQFVFEKYLELVRSLNRIPTNADLRMKSREDAQFPSHNTFTRFGSKGKFIVKLAEFCSKNSFTDILEIIEQSGINLDNETVITSEAIENKQEDGYVYLIQFGNEYKIGSSNNVERRFRELKTQMTYDGKIIHTITTGDPNGIEQYWHQFFKEKRLKGEWFQLTANDIKYFKQRKLM